MFAQVFRVKTFRTNGFVSPAIVEHGYNLRTSVYAPWRVTMLAIWMTGSIFGSGNTPFRPAHSMSKLKILKGAVAAQLPSGACEMRWPYLW